MSNKLPKYLTAAEAKALRTTVLRGGNWRDVALIELMLTYGPRASEAGMMRFSNFDLDENTITIPRLKGGVTNVWPLFPKYRVHLERWLKYRDSPTEWIFPGNSFACMSRKRVWEIMQKYGKLADLPKEKRHPHACRHFVAVNALEAGLEIIDVQDLLGHKAIASTMVYAQVTNKRRTEAAKKLQTMG